MTKLKVDIGKLDEIVKDFMNNSKGSIESAKSIGLVLLESDQVNELFADKIKATLASLIEAVDSQDSENILREVYQDFYAVLSTGIVIGHSLAAKEGIEELP